MLYLLEPTTIYVEHIERIRKSNVELKALAHITGGGFKNVDRVLLENFRVRYEREDVFYSQDPSTPLLLLWRH